MARRDVWIVDIIGLKKILFLISTDISVRIKRLINFRRPLPVKILLRKLKVIIREFLHRSNI
jgi:hypothetical protein